MCEQNDNVKIKCTTRYLDQESLDHIIHGGSSKGLRKNKDSNWKSFTTLHTYGGHLVTLVVPLERRWVRGTWVHQGEQMYEHIAYELRYGNLSSIRLSSICMKAHYFI